MNRKRQLHYLELFVAVAGITILYLILRNFQLGEPLFMDEGKTKDLFVEWFVVGEDDGVNLGFFACCQYNIQNMVIFLLGKISGSAAVGINIYHILTFFGISFTAYWMFEKIGISHGVAVFGAVLLTVLPYHTDRGEAQIVTSSFFMVPILLAMFYDIYFVGSDMQDCRMYVIAMVLLPWIDLNLSFMAVILLLLLGLLRHEKETTVQTAICGLPALIESLILYAVAYRSDGSSLTKLAEKSKAEGLRILDFVMPVRRHIYDRFFNMRFEYDSTFGANGESGLNTLGFLLAACFAAGMLFLYFGRNETRTKIHMENQLVKWLSWINVVVILIANISGFGMLIEYLGIHVIFWNRMGIFVIVNAAVIMGIYADRVKRWYQERYAWQGLCTVVYLLIAVAAVLDVLLRHGPV